MSIDWEALAAPFTDDDLEWRGQGKPSSNGRLLILPYVTNRAIQQRLDDVVGPDRWSNAYLPGPQGGVLCTITIATDSGPVSKTDGADNTDIEAVKGGLSDAMKRAAVQWGIGRYLYSLPKYFVSEDKKGSGYYKGFGRFSPPKLNGPARQAKSSAPPKTQEVEAVPAEGKPQAASAGRASACLAYFEKQGVFKDELEQYLSKPVIEWTDGDIDTLKSAYGI
jgi:hypothetical protein